MGFKHEEAPSAISALDQLPPLQTFMGARGGRTWVFACHPSSKESEQNPEDDVMRHPLSEVEGR